MSRRVNNRRPPYHLVRNYRDLLDMNVAFLSGDFQETYYHGGPVFPETVPLLGNLKKVNDFGFHSMSGQPSMPMSYWNEFSNYSLTVKQIRQNHGTSEISYITQKPYIQGFIENRNKNQLASFLLDEPDVFFKMCTFDTHEFFCNIPFPASNKKRKVYNVTMQGTADTTGKPISMIFETNISNEYIFNLPSEFDEHLKKLDNIFKTLSFVVIVGGTYGKGNLEDALLRFFKKHPEAKTYGWHKNMKSIRSFK